MSQASHNHLRRAAVATGLAVGSLLPGVLADQAGATPVESPTPLTQSGDMSEVGKQLAAIATGVVNETPTRSTTESPQLTITQTNAPATQAEAPHTFSEAEQEPPRKGGPGTPGSEIEPSKQELRKLEMPPEIPANVKTLMAENTVYIDGNGCSGFLIRNAEGAAAGVLSAQHCFTRYEHIEGNDDQTYIVTEETSVLTAEEDKQSTAYVGRFNQLITGSEAGVSSDIALGVLAGHTAEEVMRNYDALTKDEVEGLKTGDTMYMSGWPVDQDNNYSKYPRRQSFALTIVGTEIATGSGSNPKTMRILWAAAPSTADGAECSFGASGSEGFIMQEVVQPDGTKKQVPRSVGTLALFSDITGDTANTPEQAAMYRQYFENEFGVDLTGMSVMCGFSYEVPGRDMQTEITKITWDTKEIPGYVEPYERLQNNAREHFLDPSTPKYILDGYVYRGGGKGEDGQTYVTAIDRPYLYYDEGIKGYVIGYYDQKAEGNLALETVLDVMLYDRDGNPGVLALKTTGEIKPGPTDATGSSVLFQDSAGLTFGQEIVLINPNNEPYIVSTLDGEPFTAPAKYGGKGGGTTDDVGANQDGNGIQK